MSAQPHARSRPVPAYAALALVLLLGLALVPLPGIDQVAALHQMGRSSAWWVQLAAPWPPAFSPLSTGLMGLVVARLAMDLMITPGQDDLARRLWISIATGLYLGGTFAGGVALGLTLDLRFNHLLVVSDKLVLAMLIGISTTATAAALWSLATLVKRSALASGALLLFGVWELVRMGRFLAELSFALLSPEGPEPGLGWMPLHTGLVPLGLVCMALWRWTPGPLPLPVARSLVVRGPLDLLVLPLVVGALAGTLSADMSGVPAWTPQSPLYDQGLLARSLASLLIVPALSVWMRRQPGAPGHVGWAIAGGTLLMLSAVGLGITLWISP